ncbi:MAG: transcription-repair coupling factor [bacterium]
MPKAADMNNIENLLVSQITHSVSFTRLHGDIKANHRRIIPLKGLRASSLGGVVVGLEQCLSGNMSDPAFAVPLILVVTSNHDHATEVYDDLLFFGARKAFHYPKPQALPYEDDTPLLEEQVKHLEFLDHLAAGAHLNGSDNIPSVCVTSIEALFTRVAPLDVLKSLILRVEWGEPLDTEIFAAKVTDLGYERVPTVEVRGEFAIRGGIIDIFPLNFENPIRIDLFGDEIESMRCFDVHTQRSIKAGGVAESLVILPARESVLIEKALSADVGEQDAAAHAGLGIQDSDLSRPLPTLLDLLPHNTLLLFHGLETYPVLDERFRQFAQRQFKEHGIGHPPPVVLHATLNDVEKSAQRFRQLHHTLLIEESAGRSITFQTNSFEAIKPSLEHYITQLRKRIADNYLCAIVCDNDGQAQRMMEMLGENEIGAVTPSKSEFRIPNAELPNSVIVITGLLHNGFIYPEANLYVVTDREIFGRYKRRHVYRKIYKGAPIADAREIRKGDFVVHLDHGIGRFDGIRTQFVDGRHIDLLEIVYADGDKLLVPVDKIAYVHKYSGAEQAAPSLDKLGGRKWVQRRKKSEEAVQAFAQELMKLYAQRSLAKGYAAGGDTPWQREFEASFIYSETPDQLRAINEVKHDMMLDKPMDRLVCGDVGYGKTEVAIRAAFKTIQERRQVALLCPTTILAQQHYNTFRERFADYPIRVEMLSRFKTATEAKKILAAARVGDVDMVIGTHALLSKSVRFKSIGLVIVDEEQRFGVAQKERLKEMRASVDFITLTATPIPRTLYMSLSGLRDMSLINTPPADRHPIKTRLIYWDRELIEEAILRELNRGGQVFFVHNRVMNIHQIAERVKEIVPSARLAIAHGQMPDEELENVMIDFVDGKYDILLSTTIIENGVDIPNVNTIIINRADAFGLAQLYQLRGRVGRENRRAYAYLIVPTGQAITEAAVARLAAIEEFTELGVGFNIAMRDMEIRGAGNLLGREQHGTICSVGFELYCKMLEEAVDTMRGQLHEEEQHETEIQWKADAYIPAYFVPVEAQRVMLYKRIAEARTMDEIAEVESEIRDRYGEVRIAKEDSGTTEIKASGALEDLPAPVNALFVVARMRIAGRGLGIRKIIATTCGFKLCCPGAVKELGPRASKLIKNGTPRIYTDDPNALEFYYADWKKRPMLRETLQVLDTMHAQ